MRNVHARSTAVRAAALLVAGASLAPAQMVSFSGELTTGTTGWVKQGTSRMNWIVATPPALSYIAADNIQGTQEVGTFSRALPKRFEGKHDWAATVNSFAIRSTGAALSYNSLYIGLVETNGWTASDFAGVRILDNNSAAVRRARAELKDGATTWTGATFNLANGVLYRIDMGYTNKVMVVSFTRTSDNFVVGTSTATATGSPAFSWGHFGFGNGAGLAYVSNGFSITSTRDISFSGYIPRSSTLIAIR